MSDIFSITSAPLWLIALFSILLYSIVVGSLRLLLSRAMVGSLDPLNIRIVVFIGPAVLGLVLLPFVATIAAESYHLILLFMGIWFFLIRVGGKPRKINLHDQMDVGFQTTLLFLAALIILANITINMIIPGKIPLLMEGGGLNLRFEATENSRLLTWFSFAITPVPGLIYAVTENSRVRRFAVVAVTLQMAESLLFASKAGILTIVFILLNTLFMAKIRNDQERYKSVRRNLLIAIFSVALLAPAYLTIIGAGSGLQAVSLLAMRFLGGFDQLIFASQLNLLSSHGSDAVFRSGLFEYQLMPFFKVILSKQYEYSNVGQYVIEKLTGVSVNGLGTYPNSNLILEAIFTSGRYLGALLFSLELGLFYGCRRLILRGPITPWSLVLVQALIFDPTGLFSSGQDWVTQTALASLTVFVALILSRVYSWITASLGGAAVQVAGSRRARSA